MIRKEYGQYYIVCDICGIVSSHAYDNYQDADRQNFHEGFEMDKEMHLCANCSFKYQL